MSIITKLFKSLTGYVIVPILVFVPQIKTEIVTMITVFYAMLYFYSTMHASKKEWYSYPLSFIYILTNLTFLQILRHDPQNAYKYHFVIFIIYIYSAYLCIPTQGASVNSVRIATTLIRIFIISSPYFISYHCKDPILSSPIRDAIVVSLLLDTVLIKPFEDYLKKKR